MVELNVRLTEEQNYIRKLEAENKRHKNVDRHLEGLQVENRELLGEGRRKEDEGYGMMGELIGKQQTQIEELRRRLESGARLEEELRERLEGLEGELKRVQIKNKGYEKVFPVLINNVKKSEKLHVEECELLREIAMGELYKNVRAECDPSYRTPDNGDVKSGKEEGGSWGLSEEKADGVSSKEAKGVRDFSDLVKGLPHGHKGLAQHARAQVDCD